MNNEKLEIAASRMENMDNDAKVWSMIRAISHLMAEDGVTYSQCITVFKTILNYTEHEAEIMSSDLPEEVNLDGEDGEWYEIPAIG